MAEKRSQESTPFTNVRLMIAAIVFGVIGAVLTLHVITAKIEDATGGTIKVMVLTRNLSVDEGLQAKHVKPVSVPMVFGKTIEHIMTAAEFPAYEGVRPIRNMFAGEILSVHGFLEESKRFGAVTSRREGVITTSLKIDPRRNLGKQLRIGDLINITGTFVLDEKVAPEGEVLTVLEQVRVVGINGEMSPVDRVNSVIIEVGQKSSNLVTYLASSNKQRGLYAVDKAIRGARTAQVNKEVPKATKDRLRLTIGLPANFD